MSQIVEAWKALSESAKGIVVLLGVLSLWTGIVLAAAGWVSLPERVGALEDKVMELRISQEEIRLNTCLTLAEVRGDITTDRCRR